MSKTLCALLLFFFLCLFPSFLQGWNYTDIIGDTFEETSGSGLVILTNPPGVTVYIDGIERGVTPLTIDPMLHGSYGVTLNKDDYKERRFNITMYNNSRLTVSIEMKENRNLIQVSVHRDAGSHAETGHDSLPFNPQILITSGEVLSQNILESGGVTAQLSLPAGYNTIKVRAFGWEEKTATLFAAEETAGADIFMKPAQFNLGNAAQNRRQFNPKNSGNLGRAEFSFEVSAPGSGTFTIQNKNGEAVHKSPIGNFDTWHQTVTWNGRDSLGKPLPEGRYTVLIEASPVTQTASLQTAPLQTAQITLTMETEINYSISIFPLSLSGGISGMVFAPLPHVLPQGSFQIDSGIIAGTFPGESFLSCLPFEMGVRFSPLRRLEFAANINIRPRFKDVSAEWGAGGSAKFNILSGEDSIPLALAAGVFGAWAGEADEADEADTADETGEAPLSCGKGGGIYLPFSVELSNFSIVFSPGFFLHIQDDTVPLLLFSGGILYRHEWINTGLSARYELDFTGEQINARLLAGAEARFYPPPSNLVFSLIGGIWKQSECMGGFGGLGFGVIY